MNCTEFKIGLESEESLNASKILLEHALICSECAKLLAVNEKMRLGLEVNRKAVPTPNLTPLIMQKAATQKIEVPTDVGFLEKLVACIAPNSPVRSMLYYGFAIVIIFVLCQAVIRKGIDLKAEKVAPSWTLLSSRGSIETSNSLNVRPGSKLPFESRINCAAGEVDLSYGTFCKVSVHSGEILLASGALHCFNGVFDAELHRKPNDATVKFFTPHSEIIDIGTKFNVAVSQSSSSITLYEGKLRVISLAGSIEREVGEPGTVIVVSQNGFVTPNMISESSTAASETPEFFRRQAPSE